VKLAISGTYSSGKTLTSYALAHYVDIPRTRARTMRELLPIAVPGKTLEECTGAELIQLIVRRHVERCVHESHLTKGFVSDGSSLQEWLYGAVRVIVGINPNDSVHLSDVETVTRTPEMEFFDAVMSQLGSAIKDHVRETYDAFVHLPNELELAKDGHRPVNERFRRLADEGIACDVCPTSNVLLSVAHTLEACALGPLLDAGVRCSVNADDPLLFGSDLLDEYELCRD